MKSVAHMPCGCRKTPKNVRFCLIGAAYSLRVFFHTRSRTDCIGCGFHRCQLRQFADVCEISPNFLLPDGDRGAGLGPPPQTFRRPIVKFQCRIQPSEIQVFDTERIPDDEIAPGLHFTAHQLDEQLVGFGDIFDTDLNQGSRVRVQGGFPQLVRIHLSQPLVALQRQAALAFFLHRRDQFRWEC